MKLTNYGPKSGRFKDITNKKFGTLTVISYSQSIKGRAYWLCRCDCSNEKIISSGHLKHNKSCGVCLKRKNYKLPKGIASFKEVFRNYKNNAKKRNLIFDLGEHQFKIIIEQDCFYCGTKPANVKDRRDRNGSFIYNGLDRVDNSKGYISDNIVPCCKICNRAKDTMSKTEFFNWVGKVYEKAKRII